jgi:hypothetical protein
MLQSVRMSCDVAPCLAGEKYPLPAGRNITKEEKTYVYRDCADSS